MDQIRDDAVRGHESVQKLALQLTFFSVTLGAIKTGHERLRILNQAMTPIPGPYVSLKWTLPMANRALLIALSIRKIFAKEKNIWQVVQRYGLPKNVGLRL